MCSPQNIITDQYLSYDNHCKFRFGYYVESHEDHKINNNMEEQTVSGIYLGTPANFQGSYKIFSLKTGCVVTRKNKIREIQKTTWAIQCVEVLEMSYGRDLADGDETLFVDQFSNRNYLDVAIHESGIIGVVQDENEQDDDNENENRKTNEYP